MSLVNFSCRWPMDDHFSNVDSGRTVRLYQLFQAILVKGRPVCSQTRAATCELMSTRRLRQ